MARETKAKQLEYRIVARLRQGECYVPRLASDLRVKRTVLDRALSRLGTRVWWMRIGAGGDRIYGLRRTDGS